jgi:predicted  nucleic acid-binding Zn-ribbon protein
MSGRATIGCEGGSSVLDWCGEIRAQIQAMLAADPGLSFEAISACMPKGWDAYRFLTITPRHFEAVITKTCQVLVEGDYRGVLEPDRHYIPIKRDFSNLDQALKKLCDKDLVHDIVERAYADIYLNNRYTYSAFAELIDQALEDFDQAATSDGVAEMSNERQAWLTLEQQLIAEKHNGFLLQAKNQEAMVRLARLEVDLQVARNHELQRQEELSKAQARLQSVQEQLSLTQASLQATQARLDHAKKLLERPFVAFAYAARLHNKKLAVLISLFLTLLSALIVAFRA